MNDRKIIVVGVDGSAGSRRALTWAAAEAASHGSDLVVVNVWEHTLLPPAGSVSVSEHYVPDPSQRTADDRLVFGGRGAPYRRRRRSGCRCR